MNDTTSIAPAAWVSDLLTLWSESDNAAALQNMGFPTASAFVQDACAEADDEAGFTPTEVAAMASATRWLARRHPDHWRALSREYRPWTQRTLPAKVGDTHLVKTALAMLGTHINEAL